MIDTIYTFTKVESWEGACAEIRILLASATDAEKPGLLKALERLDETRRGVIAYHDKAVKAAENEARRLGEIA